MNRLFFACCVVFSVLIAHPAYAQKDLELHYSCTKTGAGFAHVYVLDHRVQGQLIGYVQTGVMNRLKSIEFNGSLADSLARFFQPEHASIRSNREVALVLNDVFMSEQTHSFSEDGRLSLSVQLFLKNDEGKFQPLITIDSTYTVSAFDVTNTMLRSLSDRFCSLAWDAESAFPDTAVAYTMEDLQNLDSMEMLRIPAFVTTPRQGIYRSYQSFKMNMPDVLADISIDTSSDGTYNVYQTEHKTNGKLKKAHVQRSSAIYAISDGEQRIKYFEDGWYPIGKTGTGFYFDSKKAFSSNAAMWGGIIGGIAGSAIGQSIDKKNRLLYRFKINHRTGKPVPAAIIEQE